MEAREDRSSGLYWACVVLGSLQFVAVYYFASGTGTWVEAARTVSAGVAASAIWWAVFSRYAESEGRGFLDAQLKAQRGQLNAELSAHRGLLVAEIEETTRRWRTNSLPRDIYPATDGFDRRFNRDLTRDLRHSSKYFFWGPSGIYVPARILLREAGSHPLEDIRLKVIDPLSDLAMSQAVSDRRRKAIHEDKSDAEIRGDLIDDLYMTVVALWHARRQVKGAIRIWYESTAVIKRVEVFDDAVYDSNIDVAGIESFPLTGCWAEGQPAFVQVNEEFHRQDHARASLRITASTREEELLGHLNKLELDPTRMGEIWDAYQAKYVSYLESLLPKALALNEIEPIDEREEDEEEKVRT